MTLLVWIATSVLMGLGLAGTLLPGLPGTPLILLGAVIHKLFLPHLTWWTIAILASLTALSVLLEAGFTVAGARFGRGTKWGLLGSGAGALLGLLGGPVGALAGAVTGAVVGELFFARQPLEQAVKAGLGAGLGLIASGAGKLAVAAAMIAIFALACRLERL
ncbi:MAG: hypothetical protein A2X36_08205 [Elusimicrobia bacterium GWA2_69_24]|nr:MAG: hypothetical protein A2X36_08205 [Elusimicrobia bacterium GWA2_69_24]